MNFNKIINYYFLFLFSFIPVSIILGSSISLINILLIDLSFLIFLFFYKKDFNFLKSEPIKYLIILYIYLIFNSLISLDQSIGLERNFGFIRIIVFFVALNYFFKDKFFYQKTFLIWIIIISLVLFDVLFESINGQNTLGYDSPYGRRIVSFFKDEPIVGGYLNAFYLILIGFLNLKFKNKYFNLITLFAIIYFSCIFLTGERSNTIKAIMGISLFYIFFKGYKLKYKLGFFLVGVLVISSVILNSAWFKARYIDQIKVTLTSDKLYLDLYKSGFEIFKNYPMFGVGNKNYRVVACGQIQNEKIVKSNLLCTTHPHQIYFEFLSEHGIIGFIFLIFIFYKLIFSKLYFYYKDINYIQLGASIYILFIFTPLIPSGAFFSDYSLTIFGLNVAIFYAVNKKFNIFLIKKKNKIY